MTASVLQPTYIRLCWLVSVFCQPVQYACAKMASRVGKHETSYKKVKWLGRRHVLLVGYRVRSLVRKAWRFPVVSFAARCLGRSGRTYQYIYIIHPSVHPSIHTSIHSSFIQILVTQWLRPRSDSHNATSQGNNGTTIAVECTVYEIQCVNKENRFPQ